MIRINLVAERKVEKARGREGPSAAPGALQLYLLLALFAGGATLVSGGLWYFKKMAIEDLNRKIAEAQKRQKELQAIKAQVDAFQAKKKTLEDKVNLIERLKTEQSGPVHMLDEISKALPDLVWLVDMDQSGAGIKLTGESTGLTSVADFIANLQRSGWFPPEQVNLVSSSEVTVVGAGAPIVKFVVSAQFKDPAIAAKEKAAAAAAAAAPPSPPPSPAGKKS